MNATKTKGVDSMEKEQATWWLDCLRALLLDEKIVTVCCYEYCGWKPEIRHGVVDKVHQNDFDWGSTLTIHTTDYGIYCGIANIEIRPDGRTVLVTGHTPEGRGFWWAFSVIREDMGQHQVFKFWHDRSLCLKDTGSER